MWFIRRKPSPPVTRGVLVYVRFVNNSKTVGDGEIQAAIPDFQTQVSEHFAPEWLVDAQLYFGSGNPMRYVVSIEDDSDVPGTLGYHENDTGLPTSHVFARTAQQHNIPWTGVCSHELLEMLGDPRTNLGAIVDTSPKQDGTQGKFVIAEACDAVEQSTYIVGKTVVSNFVFPSWWDQKAKGPYDYLGKLSTPLELLPGGSYISVIEFTSVKGWQSPTAEKK